ncbi:glycosyltransferase family 2 protein [Pelotomaculum propionicicum]|nr:glycosyltransferase [Pelotomaculum propionicicum]NLI12520.1 glycosyltransferase [Peptococcaceae bacterium]
MLAAVVPVLNEEKRVKKTLETLLSLPSDLIVPVINGSSDNSGSIIRQIKSPRVLPLEFIEPLGIDIPRAVGAKVALDRGATAVLFVDGDMNGNIAGNLRELVAKLWGNGADMALTDCYPGEYQASLSSLAFEVLNARTKLNKAIGLNGSIGAASPSHGPHAVSRRLLQSVPLRELAIPPVSLGLAVKKNLKIIVGTTIPHKALGSPDKDPVHSELIAQTIIGDCAEALYAFRNEKRRRIFNDVEYNGYHPQRRWDLLEDFCQGKYKNPGS